MELLSLGTTLMMEFTDNSSNYNSSSTTVDYLITCSEASSDCVIDHSVHCVGDEVYCNLTREEYTKLLYDYIFPSFMEWILIISHIMVFLMGLVSDKRILSSFYTIFFNYYFSIARKCIGMSCCLFESLNANCNKHFYSKSW
jgi:hypothetical protein